MQINNNAYIISGAPGSGKTTVLKALQQRGIDFFEEPARAIIREQRSIDGEGIYDKNPSLFKELMLSRALYQFLNAQKNTTPCFFDRGLPDLLAYSACFELPSGAEKKAALRCRYNSTVFFAPCWEAIFTHDEDRTLSFSDAQSFDQHLRAIYTELNYTLVELPCTSPEKRAHFILETLAPSLIKER